MMKNYKIAVELTETLSRTVIQEVTARSHEQAVDLAYREVKELYNACDIVPDEDDLCGKCEITVLVFEK